MSLQTLKNKLSDKQKVLSWLARIGERDQRCIDEVMKQCEIDKSAREYYVSRYEEQ
jgi:2-hydroxy-3-keto-5-methylthiopentenyl-1-phosphate phosphatase